MSQIPNSTQNTGPVVTVRPKVRMPHPSLAAAEQFRKETASLRGPQPGSNEQGTTVTPTPNVPVPPPAPQPQPAPIPPMMTPPAPDPAPAPAPAPAPQVQTVPAGNVPLPDNFRDLFGTANDTGSRPTKPEPPAPTYTEEQFRQRNAALLAELERTRNELAEARKLPDELRQLQAERELDTLLQSTGNEFTSIDKEDAKKLLAPVINNMRKQYTQSNQQVESRMQTLEAELHKQVAQIKEHERLERLGRTRDAILKAHPDLEQLQKSPAYQQMMMSPIGDNSGILIGQVVAAEYQQGNADYIISVLNKIKQNSAQNDINAIASVSPSSATPTPVSTDPAEGNRLTPEQISEYKFKVQTGQMSRNEFRDIMKKHREAQR